MQSHNTLTHNGLKTQGSVVKQYNKTGNRGYGKNHYLVYRFTDSQAQVYENQIIRTEPGRLFKVGKNIEIIYDPRDPNINIPSILMPDNMYKPLYNAFTFMAGALGGTFAFGAFVFSRFAQTTLHLSSLKRFFDNRTDHHRK